MGNQRPARSRLASVVAAASPDPACLLPAAIHVDDADTPADIVDALILSAFTDGRQPYARTAKVSELRPGAALTPPGARTLRAARSDWAGKAGLALLMTLSVAGGFEALRLVRGHAADLIGIGVAAWRCGTGTA